MIIIDATSVRDRITGIERYTIETSYRIAQLANADGIATAIALPKESIYPDGKIEFFTHCLRSPFSSRILTEQLWLPWIIRRSKAAFFPAFPPGILTYKLSPKTKITHTIHDGVMWKHQDTLSLKNKIYMRPLENYGVHRYSSIETVSEFSKKEISSIFPEVSDKIYNSGNGVNLIKPKKTIRPLQEKYLLFVGTIEPRKNLPFLITIFNEIQAINPKIKLVIAGRKGWGIDALNKSISRHSLEDKVIVLGSVTDDELNSLYAHAELFIYPSIYEGFGLPVLEAMAAGLPVISSDGGALPEAVGDGGIVIPLGKKDLWCDAVTSILNNTSHRLELISKGQKHFKKFSWDSVAQKIYSRINK